MKRRREEESPEWRESTPRVALRRLRSVEQPKKSVKQSQERLQTPILSLPPSGSSLLSLLALLILCLPLAMAEQLPLPIDAAAQAGVPAFSQLTADLIGDRGSYTIPAIADFDADGDYDMVVGRNNGFVEYWRNDGNSTNATWVLENGDLVGDVGSRASPTVTDFDSDGDFDMFIGKNNGYIRYYRNDGTPTTPSFTFIRNMIDIGSQAMPEAIDYNDDGDTDLYYGRDATSIYRFKNDVAESGFDFRDFVISDVGTYSSVSFADIDDDGDFDAFVGDNNGNVRLFKNLGGSNAGVFTTANPNFWDMGTVLFDVGSRADPALADLDNDGDFDLLIGRSDGTFIYYRNDGTAKNAFWTLVPDFLTADVGDNSAPTLADIDGDTDFDLIIGSNAGFLSLYENQGTPENPTFVLSGSSLVGDIGDDANPVLADLDNDNDLDLAIGRSDGVILYYENTGNATSFTFTSAGNVLNDYNDFTTPSFADLDGDGDLDLGTGAGAQGGWISLIENTGSVSSFSFSNARTFWNDNRGRGFNPDFTDFDNDGDQDMIVGQENGFIYYYRNDGTAEIPIWTLVRNFIGDWGSWTDATWGDLNNDGRIDFILGRSSDLVFRYFKNDVDESGFNLVQNTSDLIGDVGGYADPLFADFDADGDFDMMMGAQDGRVRYYRNDGTATAPLFVAQADPIADQGSFSSLSAGDLDADGDLDLVLGRSNDALIRYFSNEGNATNFSFVLANSDFLVGSCGSTYCVPSLVDLDNDNDFDMVIGSSNGITKYYRNDGTPTISVWSDQGTLIGDLGSYSGPDLADLDGDGDFDMLIGTSNGLIRYYKNIGTPGSHSFIYVYAGDGGTAFLPDLGGYSKPKMVDLDNDGNLEIPIGLESGFTYLYDNNGHWQNDVDRGNNPTWLAQDTNLFDSNCDPTNGNAYCNGELIDIDNDGDLDVIGGNWFTAPRFWENTGDANTYIFIDRGALVGDFGDGHDTTLGDFDGDGDADMLIGYTDGRTRYFKNIGTPTSPSFQFVYRGTFGGDFLPDLGDYSRVGAVDINNDGLIDIAFTETVAGSTATEQRFLRNYGILTDPQRRADNPTWLTDGTIFSTGRNYNKPSTADIDGDGDLDLLVGDDLNRIYYYRNEGTQGSPSYVFEAQLFDFGSDWGRPALLDFDGDGDFDFYSGEGSGLIRAIENQGDYSVATTVTLKATNGTPVVGADVVLSDSSGVACSNQTDTNGQVRCPLSFIGNEGKVTVTNAQPGTVTLGIFSPNSRGRTFMTLNSPATSFVIDLERFVFQTYDVENNPNSMRITISDEGATVFSELTDAGFIDGFFPRRYLENKQEPFTQNRITYDVTLEKNNQYDSDLSLDGLFVPNEVNFNSAAPSGKLYKLLSTHQMSTDAEYRGYVIFPALSAQREYVLEDSIPDNFTYTGEATASYLGQQCSIGINGTNYTISGATSGCSFLNDPVQAAADWLKFEFTVRTPSLDTFITAGLTNQSYSFPAAQLSLIS